MILEGHTEEVNSVAFSPDGSWIVSCSSDHTARIWEVSSGESRAIFEKHGVPITAAAFSTDGLQVALGDAHGCVILWNIFSGLKATGAHYDTHSIICIAYRRDDAHVVSCTKTTICFMAVLACQLVRVIHLEDLCLVSAEIQTMSPDASRVCILHRFGSLNIWDIGDDLDLVQRINLDGCSKLAFSADGQRAVFLNPHHALELIDFHDDGDIVSRTSEIHHSVHVLAVSSAAPASVALYGDSDVVLLRDLVSATQVVSRSMATLGQHATQSLSLDGRWVVSGSKVGTIGIWETNDEASTSLSSPAPNQRDSVSMTHLSRDGMWLTCVMSKGLIIYNTTHGNVLASLDLSPAKPEGVFLGDTLWMAMSPDSVRLAFFVKTEKFAPSSGHLCIWHLYERTLHYFPPTTPITHQSSRHDRHCPVLWSLDSSLCAVVVTGGRVHVWDVIAWTLKADLDLPGLGEFSYLHHAEFSSDGRHLLLIFWKIIHDRIKRLDIFIWSTNNWLLDSVNVEFSERDINPMYIPSSKVSAFSPKGTDLITFRRATGGLYLRNIGDHESLSQMCQNHTRIQEVVWSCDSSHVALMNRRREVMVWSTALGTASSQLTKISHHNLSGDTLKPVEPAFSSSGLLSFSADGRRICARSSGVENHWKIGADFITLSLDNPAREMIATTGGVSVDIIASDRSGWLRYSRSDRANLVSLLWVPFQRRWLKPEDVQVTGSKVAFRSASGELTTILDFPYLLDLYRLSEPDHNA
jgi:WD40 repeat protein